MIEMSRRWNRFVAVFFCAAVIALFGCGGDADEDSSASQWDGEWTIESIAGENLKESMNAVMADSGYRSATDARMTLRSRNNTFQMSFRVDLVEFVGPDGESSPVKDIYFVVTFGGTFTVTDHQYRMTMDPNQIKADVSQGIENLGMTDSDVRALFGDPGSELDDLTDTGTWERDGDRLILRDDDDEATILVKR